MTSVAVHCVVLFCACEGHWFRDEFCSCSNNSKSILKSTLIIEKQSKSEFKPTYARNCVYFREQSYGQVYKIMGKELLASWLLISLVF